MATGLVGVLAVLVSGCGAFVVVDMAQGPTMRSKHRDHSQRMRCKRSSACPHRLGSRIPLVRGPDVRISTRSSESTTSATLPVPKRSLRLPICSGPTLAGDRNMQRVTTCIAVLDYVRRLEPRSKSIGPLVHPHHGRCREYTANRACGTALAAPEVHGSLAAPEFTVTPRRYDVPMQPTAERGRDTHYVRTPSMGNERNFWWPAHRTAPKSGMVSFLGHAPERACATRLSHYATCTRPKAITDRPNSWMTPQSNPTTRQPTTAS